MLKVQNIRKIFPRSDVPVLDGLTLSLAKRQFCVLIGSNGSGKSVLMRCITGIHNVDAGRIMLDNEDISQQNTMQIAKCVAMVIQDVNIGTIGDMTVFENMVLSYIRGDSSNMQFYTAHREKIEKAVTTAGLGMERYIDKKLNSLSDGQRQAIATIMAIASSPDLLLLDEHTSALDPNMHNMLMQYTVDSIVASKMTALMITHQLSDAIKYGDRLIMLHKGRIVMDVSGDEKYNLTMQLLLDSLRNVGESL